MQTLDGSETKIAFKKTYRKDNIVKVSENRLKRNVF
jgi:hypothetical protein